MAALSRGGSWVMATTTSDGLTITSLADVLVQRLHRLRCLECGREYHGESDSRCPECDANGEPAGAPPGDPEQ